jgi:hypothetical protein
MFRYGHLKFGFGKFSDVLLTGDQKNVAGLACTSRHGFYRMFRMTDT